METWYGVAGMGAIYNPINPRLHIDQIVGIANHAEDGALFFDPSLSEMVAAMAPRLPKVRLFVALASTAPPADIPGLIAYDDLIAEGAGNFTWPAIDENTACGLCYTSGTTGPPKGVLYSHRSTVLHAMSAALPDAFDISARDTIMPIVPMFHANGWGIPFAAALTGAKLVLPGSRLDSASLIAMLNAEKVSVTAAVPTIWLPLLRTLEETGERLPYLKRVIIGGAACPRGVIETFEKRYGIEVRHSWGMTETSPVGTIAGPKAKHLELAYERQLDIKLKQGRPLFGVEMKITDADNRTLPNDGVTSGHLKVRGPAVAKSYYLQDEAIDAEGWFDTGDIATIDGDGTMTITDRAKDLIKSGGEWISSAEIEIHAMSHPAVAEAAVIGVRHPKWDERPLVVVVLRPGQGASKQDILRHLSGKIAKWWMPDDVVFVDAIPHSATGKVQKTALRERFASHLKPG
jgi:fatty-acyl-CoA synthase